MKTADFLLLIALTYIASGCADVASLVGPDVTSDIAILHPTGAKGTVKTHCPVGSDCTEISLADVECDGSQVNVVVLTGHSAPPTYAGHSAGYVARRVACLQPKLLVLDTSYGFSAALLHELAVRDVDGMVVGSTSKLRPDGLLYSPAFYNKNAAIGTRAQAVSARFGPELERWKVDRLEIEAALVDVDGLDFSTLVRRTQRRGPNLVSAPLRDGVAVVVEVDPARYR